MADSTNNTWGIIALAIGLPSSLVAVCFSLLAYNRAGVQLAAVQTELSTPAQTSIEDVQATLDTMITDAVRDASAQAQPEIEAQTRRIQALVELQLAQNPAPVMVEVKAPEITQPETKPADEGQQIARRFCASCHSFDNGGSHRVGPNLYGVVEAAAGSKDGFRYSRALAESGLVWNAQTLDGFLDNPRDYLNGTKMTYTGLRDESARAAVIGYLTSLGASQ